MIIKATKEQLAERMKHRPPEYLKEIEPALTMRSDGMIYIDTEHPAWKRAMEKYQQVRAIESSPCVGCGDKTNIAELRSDPRAMERLLAGE